MCVYREETLCIRDSCYPLTLLQHSVLLIRQVTICQIGLFLCVCMFKQQIGFLFSQAQTNFPSEINKVSNIQRGII